MVDDQRNVGPDGGDDGPSGGLHQRRARREMLAEAGAVAVAVAVAEAAGVAAAVAKAGGCGRTPPPLPPSASRTCSREKISSMSNPATIMATMVP